MDAAFRALADPTRRDILRLLRDVPLTSGGEARARLRWYTNRPPRIRRWDRPHSRVGGLGCHDPVRHSSIAERRERYLHDRP